MPIEERKKGKFKIFNFFVTFLIYNDSRWMKGL